MAKDRNNYLIKNTIIFTLGSFGSKIISFFLVPLYTYVLTASEYGVVDLVVTVGTVAIPILTLNISEAVMRFALDKDADKEKITQIGTGILLIGILVGLLIFPVYTISFYHFICNKKYCYNLASIHKGCHHCVHCHFIYHRRRQCC